MYMRDLVRGIKVFGIGQTDEALVGHRCHMK
jgi:hypothetical protein